MSSFDLSRASHLDLVALKQAYRLSYRQIPIFAERWFGKIPSLSTLHYRVRKISERRFEEFLDWLSKKGGFMRKEWEALQKRLSEAKYHPFALLSPIGQLRKLNSPSVQELEQLEAMLRQKAEDQISHYGTLLH